MALGDNLIGKGLLTKAQLDKALEEQKKTPGVKLGELLIRLGMATKEQVESSL
jgi:type IV pilus assembly protein PilB